MNYLVSTKSGGSYDVTRLYGWYSDNSVLLEDPTVYLGPNNNNNNFIRRLIDVLRYVAFAQAYRRNSTNKRRRFVCARLYV